MMMMMRIMVIVLAYVESKERDEMKRSILFIDLRALFFCMLLAHSFSF